MFKAVKLNNSFSTISNLPDKDSPSLSSNQHIPDNTEAKFSYYKRPIRNTTPYNDIGISNVARAIKGNRAKKVTQGLRAIEDVGEARAYKSSQFDYATFSGTFSKRSDKSLDNYSGLMVLDLDDVNAENEKRKLLNQTKFDIALMFTSPSGNGVKVVVPSTTVEEHEQVFGMYKRCLKDEFNLAVDE